MNKHAVYTDYHIQFVRVRTADFHVFFSVILFTVGQDYSLNPQISIIASASTRRQRHAWWFFGCQNCVICFFFRISPLFSLSLLLLFVNQREGTGNQHSCSTKDSYIRKQIHTECRCQVRLKKYSLCHFLIALMRHHETVFSLLYTMRDNVVQLVTIAHKFNLIKWAFPKEVKKIVYNLNASNPLVSEKEPSW